MLNAELMAQEIIAELEAAGFKPTDAKAAGTDPWQAIAKGIVKHIQEAAQVTVSSGSSAGSYKVE